MSNFPSDYDDDVSLPIVNDNITEIGAEAINALREAVFNIEQEVGLTGSGSVGSIAVRLGVSILPDGTINPSAITGLGLVTLPITNSQISSSAQIPESKLVLDHSTQDLYNYVSNLSSDVNSAIGWISSTGVKLEPHLVGTIYRHTLSHIDVTTNTAQYLKNKFETLRNNSNSYNLINDINNELLEHQFADGSPFGAIQNITTNNGSVYPSNYGHTASGIFLNTDRFSTIPQTAQDLQSFAQFIDNSSIFLYGTRIQNLYTNGISRVSRSSSLSTDGYGAPIIPSTPAITYLLNNGSNSGPFDDINSGDDIIELKPTSGELANNSFDEKFALVKVGDIIRVNYGIIEVPFLIKEKKYIQNGGNKKFIIRIAGKNLSYTTTALVRVDRPLFNNNKFGVLAIAAANNEFSEIPSLIIGSPGGAMTLGNGFNADQLDGTHYLLHLALFPTGHPSDGYIVLPGIDVTGNLGTTPGQYTLESIIEATNNSIRKAGFNYRFIAYGYEGNFGIMLADTYNNAGFSIANAVVDDDGLYDETETNINFPNNVVDVFTSVDSSLIDPLGLGVTGANVASPLYQSSYASAEAAINATKLFIPLKRNNYYVNGGEIDKLNLDIGQALDGYGDGYWTATIIDQNVYPGPIPVGRVQTTYRIMLDLSTSALKVGKTLVVQPLGQTGIENFGRFIIQDVNFGCYPNVYTDITVFDAVHGTGFSPTDTLSIGSEVGIYFNFDSVSFNEESATDFTSVGPFKRHFEIYVNLEGKTFTHERARLNASTSNLTINGVVPFYGSSELSKMEIIKVSPKLRGYLFGSVNKITLKVFNYDSTTGVYDGYLSYYDGINFTKCGPIVSGKRGEVTRFYDETHTDYIDLIFGINTVVFNFTDQLLDIQLFPTLSLDEEVMLIATCQLNDVTNVVSQIRDQRQFGNTSEKDLSTSALNYISMPERMLHSNGIIRGFDLDETVTNPNTNQIYISGGLVLVNGKFIEINPQTVSIPIIKEISGILYNINWAICINDKGEIQNIPLLDFDSTLPTPTNVNRLFNAYEIVNGSTYVLDATTFVNLITNRKDLTVLYVATSVVTSPSISITLSVVDARKFIYNESENISLTWVPSDVNSEDVSGHFKSIDAVITWANKFGSRNDTIKVKGEFTFDSTVDLRGIEKPIKLLGDSAIFNVNSNKGFLVKSNIVFEKITFNYNPTGFAVSGNINAENGCIFGDTSITNGLITDIAAKECTFNSDTSNHPPYLSFRVGSGEYINNIKINNNYFNDTVSDHDAAISFLGTYAGWTAGDAAVIANVDVSYNHCLQNQSFYFVNSFSIEGNSFSIPGLTAVNVKIYENKAGYIGYNISGNNSFSTEISGEQLFSIEKNDLIAVVGPLDETGKNPVVNSGASGATGHALPTGNVVICDNNLSFIVGECRGGVSTVDGYVGNLIIDKNRLFARNFTTAITNIFSYNPISIFFTDNNIAITVSSRNYAASSENKISTSITNNVILGSKIDGVDYGYGVGIFASGSCLITENIIKGLVNVNTSGIDRTVGIYLTRTGSGDAPKSKIHHNAIYRGDQGIYAYVRLTNNNTDITDNYFDSSYIDAAETDERVVRTSFTLSNSGTIISRNKNQIVNTYLNSSDYKVSVNGYDLGSSLGGSLLNTAVAVNCQPQRDPASATLTQFNSALAFSCTASVSNFDWLLKVSLKERLPEGVTLLSSSVRVVSSFAGGSNTISLRYNRLQTGGGSADLVFDSDTFNSPYVADTILDLSVDLSSEDWKIDPNEMYNNVNVLCSGTFYGPGAVAIDCIQIKYKW